MSNFRIQNREDLDSAARRGRTSLSPNKCKIMVGMASCGIATGAADTLQTIHETVEKTGLDVVVSQTGCLGLCEQEPLVDLIVPGQPRVTYNKVDVDRWRELAETMENGVPSSHGALCRMDAEELLLLGSKRAYRTQSSSESIETVPLYTDIPFFGKQRNIATRNCGFIDPSNIEEYIARGGYSALYKAVTEMTPEQVIEQVASSGLRGRGGGGFPTGRKWETCRNAPGDRRYVICNADEGDPGAYMDRSILEGDPHSVIEGMVIGAYAIGSHEGYVYVRSEYPLAVKILTHAIEQARSAGLLGDNIFGTGFHFDITVSCGGGAFVCGESTALMASLEGKPGEPRAKYIHTVESGLWEKPSNLNNVETWANIAPIIMRGADWFAGIGTEKSKGTKVFSLVGKVKSSGLVEIPMGRTLREIVFDLGGGVPDNSTFKAVQIGGPSGGCVPEQHIDLPVDYEALASVGSMMGSGGLIVMDSRTCMVDTARYFMQFLNEESCGKCTPCREGTTQMLELLDGICSGRGRIEDIELMRDICDVMEDASLCALGRTAGNPVRTTLRYFEDEYRAHIVDKKCPAGVCPGLFNYEIDADTCTGCGVCAKKCPQSCISGEKKEPHVIDQDKCVVCGVCYNVCPFGAIAVV